ncbi:MAG: type VI secretion system contractile sheath small subunit [Verrucomicrobiales bacterium]|nr:type VI secretion system contractile sheath small subunit [Verrucomicrobiales bacterium]
MSFSANDQRMKSSQRERVNMRYTVHTPGGTVVKELPFIATVLANLSGKANNDEPLEDRSVMKIDQHNFEKVLASVAPELDIAVKNVLTDQGGELTAKLKITKWKDLSDPKEIAKQVPALAELLKERELAQAVLNSPRALPALEKQVKAEADKRKSG